MIRVQSVIHDGAIVSRIFSVGTRRPTGVDVYSVDLLASTVAHLNEHRRMDVYPELDADDQLAGAMPDIDFADVRGQESVKRTITIATAGGHNLLTLSTLSPSRMLGFD